MGETDDIRDRIIACRAACSHLRYVFNGMAKTEKMASSLFLLKFALEALDRETDLVEVDLILAGGAQFNESIKDIEALLKVNQLTPETLIKLAIGIWENADRGDSMTTVHPDSAAKAGAVKIAHELDAIQDLLPLNKDTADGDGDDYFDPYYGDEYDRLHNQVEEGDSDPYEYYPVDRTDEDLVSLPGFQP